MWLQVRGSEKSRRDDRGDTEAQQQDSRAPLRTIRRLDRELALSVGPPAHRICGTEPRLATDDFDFVGDDEGRIESDAELADQPGILLFVAGQLLQKLGSARSRDRAQVFDDLIA